MNPNRYSMQNEEEGEEGEKVGRGGGGVRYMYFCYAKDPFVFILKSGALQEALW